MDIPLDPDVHRIAGGMYRTEVGNRVMNDRSGFAVSFAAIRQSDVRKAEGLVTTVFFPLHFGKNRCLLNSDHVFFFVKYRATQLNRNSASKTYTTEYIIPGISLSTSVLLVLSSCEKVDVVPDRLRD